MSEPWASHPELLARSPESRAILYGALDDADFGSLIVLGNEAPPPAVLSLLEIWKPLLESRADIVANEGRKPWWAAHRARNPEWMSRPKVISLYRTDRGRFALDEDGSWKPSVKATLVVGQHADAPVAYVCGLLNSELLDLWYAVRGKTPRDVWRNYEPKRMNEIPYRRPEEDPRAEEIAVLVRSIAENRRALLPHRVLFPRLTSIVKDPWKTETPAADLAAAIAVLPPADTVSVRLDSRLSLQVVETPLGTAARVEPGAIAFRRARKVTGRIEGPPQELDILEALLPGSDDPGAVLLPKDLAAFRTLIASRTSEVAKLLNEGRALVEEIERLVCALYDVPADLADEVVAHAVTRAGRGAPGTVIDDD